MPIVATAPPTTAKIFTIKSYNLGYYFLYTMFMGSISVAIYNCGYDVNKGPLPDRIE